METPPLVVPDPPRDRPNARPRRPAARPRGPRTGALAARARALHAGVSRDLARIKRRIGGAGAPPDLRALVPLIRRVQARQRRLFRTVERLRRSLRLPAIGYGGEGPGAPRGALAGPGEAPARAHAADSVLLAVAERIRALAVRA